MLKEVKVVPIHGRRKGDKTVWVRIYFPADQKQVFLTTKVTIEPEYWDKDYRRIKPVMYDSYEKQEKIDKFIYEIKYQLTKLHHDNDGIVTRDAFLEAIGRNGTGKKKPTPVYWHLYRLIESSSVSESTKKSHRQTAKLFKEFNPSLTFDEISSATAIKWDEFLHSRYTNMNTIAGHHKILVTYLNKAALSGLLSFESLKHYKEFKRPQIKGAREALHPGEVKAIEDLEYPPFSLLDNVRNLFLFGCYTGLRISDITELEKKNLIHDNSRGMVIRKEIHKLRHIGRKIELPIETLFAGKALDIINYYKNELADSPYLLPHYTHQVMNRNLKKVVHDAGLNQNITFHYARHTFLTILAMKVRDLFVVMDYGGITSVNTAQGYIHMAAKWQDEKIKNVDWSLT